MTHASICSGLDGPALAAAWLGWENLFHADINPFTNHILKYHYPHAACYTDIRQTDFSQWRGKIDVLSAGFPCQPFSVAGKRTGEDHDSYLWPETLRVVGEVRPRWFIGENVNGIASMVFPGEAVTLGLQADLFGAGREVYERTDRYVIDRICCDLEQIGYEVQPIAIPACAVGAPHERMRVFFLCHDTENPVGVRRDCCEPEEEPSQRRQRKFGAGDNVRLRGAAGSTADGSDAGVENAQGSKVGVYAVGDAPNPGSELRKERHDQRRGSRGTDRSESCTGQNYRSSRYGDAKDAADTHGQMPQCGDDKGAERRDFEGFGVESFGGMFSWDDFPTVSPVCRGDDGISDRLSREAVFAGDDPARRRDTFNHWREESIKALGNSIVPQVMYEIYRFIDIIERQTV